MRMLGAALALVAGTVVAQAAAPEDVVRAVMQLEVWQISSEGGPDAGPFSDTALATYFTPAFADAWNKVIKREEELDAPLIDSDPITNSQEYCPLRQVSIDAPKQNGDATEVAAHFQSMWCYSDAGEDAANAVTDITFVLKQDKGEWRIDDFDVGGSYRAVLKDLLTSQ